MHMEKHPTQGNMPGESHTKHSIAQGSASRHDQTRAETSDYASPHTPGEPADDPRADSILDAALGSEPQSDRVHTETLLPIENGRKALTHAQQQHVSVAEQKRNTILSGAPAGSFLTPLLEQNATRRIFVPARLARHVCSHLLKNYTRWSRNSAPLILCVTGPFGSGKTCILLECCYRLGIHVVPIRASSMESRWAGEPGERIKAAYIEASDIQVKTKEPAVVFCDDIDLGLGYFPEFSSGTRNTPHANSGVMEIADDPFKATGQPTDRVPLLVASNDASKLYEAVRRPGRMHVIHWSPSRDEVVRIAAHILDGLVTPAQMSRLTQITAPWTLAHFGQLKSVIHDRILEADVHGLSPRDIMYSAVQDRTGRCPGKHVVTSDVLESAVAEVNNSVIASRTDYTVSSHQTMDNSTPRSDT